MFHWLKLSIRRENTGKSPPFPTGIYRNPPAAEVLATLNNLA